MDSELEDCSIWEGADAGAPPAAQTPLESFLTEVQSAALASFGERDFDPKLYVDLPLRSALSVTRTAFKALPRLPSGKIAPDTLKHFIEIFFDKPGSDLLPHVPKDFRTQPQSFLPLIKTQEARAWALKVHSLWLQLSRKVAENVQNQPDMHTLLPLQYPVIVPGSRFREVYYWDSYWIIRGLAVSKMYDTAKGIVRNLFSLVQTYGFVPNGARTYYTNRSQPPLLSAMVQVVYEHTHDLDFVSEAFPVMLREYSFWQSDLHRVHIMDLKGRKHSLNRYSANWIGPRSESSTVDKQIAERLVKEKRPVLYHDIASAAESGWDFSSRWMENEEDISSMRTSSIVPVDLNAFLFQMEKNLAFFASILGEKKHVKYFLARAEARRCAIEAILWSEQMGQWVDYWLPYSNHLICSRDQQMLSKKLHILDISNRNVNVFPSNFIPLWCGVLLPGDSRIEKIVKAFSSSGLLHSAGVPSSLKQTGQQWDFPNAWAPLQHMIIEGLDLTDSKDAQIIAEVIARRWIWTNYNSFNATGEMQEKLDAQYSGKVGYGGEYTPQAGFGWSNGVVLALLQKYGWPEDSSLTSR